MTRNKSIVLYLVLSLVCLRLAGIHVHLHNHTDSLSTGGVEVAHLSTTLEHGNLHKQDFDKDILGASIMKKAGQGPGQDVSFIMVMIFILALIVLTTLLRRLPPDLPPIPVLRHLRPPVLAPPH